MVKVVQIAQKIEKEYPVPSDMKKALSKNALVQDAWKNITPIARRDFITWVESAKQSETRVRRIGITCDKIASGKKRPCCYAIVPMNLYKALGENPKAKAVWKNLNATEKRYLVSWTQEVEGKESQGLRIEKVCKNLVLKNITIKS